MTRKPIDIRYVHAGDLATKQALALLWDEGADCSRYQEIAIVGDKVVGSWQYDLEWHRGKATIDSSHTGVSERFRRRGIAKALWMHSVARWKPTHIKAMIGTDEGRAFLASMRALLSYIAPAALLNVKLREQDHDVWESLCDSEARWLLRQLGEQRMATEAKKPKQLPTTAPMLKAVP